MYCVRLLRFPTVPLFFSMALYVHMPFPLDIHVIQNISLFTLSINRSSSHQPTSHLDTHCMSATALNLSVFFIDRQHHPRVPVSLSPFPVAVAYVFTSSGSALWHWHVPSLIFPTYSRLPSVPQSSLPYITLPSYCCHLGNPLQLTIARHCVEGQ